MTQHHRRAIAAGFTVATLMASVRSAYGPPLWTRSWLILLPVLNRTEDKTVEFATLIRKVRFWIACGQSYTSPVRSDSDPEQTFGPTDMLANSNKIL